MVAVYGPALVVYSAEKSGTTPMFETIILKSRSHRVANQIFDPRHVLLGTSMRVPVGTLRFMVNWPASVRGKKASPRNGEIARLTRNSRSDRPP